MSRVTKISLIAAALMTASFATAAAASLDTGPTIEKPACEEGKCPTFTGGKLTNPITVSPETARSSAFSNDETAFAAASLNAEPTFSTATACEEGKCPTFTKGALKDPSRAIEAASLR